MAWTEDMDDLSGLARFFRALGDETRLGLVQLLARQQPDQMLCVGRLAEALRVTPSSISQHLRILKDLGLVVGERHRYRIHYRLDGERLSQYQACARALLGEEFVFPIGLPSDEEETMCEGKDCGCGEHSDCGCEHPDRCQGSPGECTPEQIRECHGDVSEHPCESHEQATGV